MPDPCRPGWLSVPGAPEPEPAASVGTPEARLLVMVADHGLARARNDCSCTSPATKIGSGLSSPVFGLCVVVQVPAAVQPIETSPRLAQQADLSAASAGLRRGIQGACSVWSKALFEADRGAHVGCYVLSRYLLDLGRHDGARIDPAAQRFDLGPGTRDSRRGAAMDGHQLDLALSAGRHAVERAKLDGVSLIWAQGQGAGSTVTNQLWRQLFQRGSQRVQYGLGSVAGGVGLTEAAAIDESCTLRRHASALSDPYRALRCLGGFEHAALVGSALAAAQLGLRWIAVGESAEIAMRLALRLNPSVEPWLQAEWSEPCLCPATADRSADPCLQ